MDLDANYCIEQLSRAFYCFCVIIVHTNNFYMYLVLADTGFLHYKLISLACIDLSMH